MKLLGLVSIALVASEVSAHGYLSQPPAAFKNGYLNTSCTATINASVDAAFADEKWDDNPVVNTFNFINSFSVSKFKTLRDLIDPVEPDCGNTVLTGEPIDVSSLHSMKWQNDQLREGFIASHHGPCEAWIDDKRVFQSFDCASVYKAYPAEIPIDYSSCTGDCTFTFYWLPLHEPEWQIFKQCAPITRSVGSETPSVSTDGSSDVVGSVSVASDSETPSVSTDGSSDVAGSASVAFDSETSSVSTGGSSDVAGSASVASDSDTVGDSDNGEAFPWIDGEAYDWTDDAEGSVEPTERHLEKQEAGIAVLAKPTLSRRTETPHFFQSSGGNKHNHTVSPAHAA